MRTHAMRTHATRILALLLALGTACSAQASGEAQKRWERMNLIRQEKFDIVLPEVMRENNVDMWITVNREGFDDRLDRKVQREFRIEPGARRQEAASPGELDQSGDVAPGRPGARTDRRLRGFGGGRHSDHREHQPVFVWQSNHFTSRHPQRHE